MYLHRNRIHCNPWQRSMGGVSKNYPRLELISLRQVNVSRTTRILNEGAKPREQTSLVVIEIPARLKPVWLSWETLAKKFSPIAAFLPEGEMPMLRNPSQPTPCARTRVTTTPTRPPTWLQIRYARPLLLHTLPPGRLSCCNYSYHRRFGDRVVSRHRNLHSRCIRVYTVTQAVRAHKLLFLTQWPRQQRAY